MVALGLVFYLKQRKIDKEKGSRHKAHPVVRKLDCFDTTNDYKENLSQTKLDTDRNVKNQLNLVCHEHGNTRQKMFFYENSRLICTTVYIIIH